MNRVDTCIWLKNTKCNVYFTDNKDAKFSTYHLLLNHSLLPVTLSVTAKLERLVLQSKNNVEKVPDCQTKNFYSHVLLKFKI